MKKIRTYQSIIAVLAICLVGCLFLIVNQEADLNEMRVKVNQLTEYVKNNELNKEYQAIQQNEAAVISATQDNYKRWEDSILAAMDRPNYAPKTAAAPPTNVGGVGTAGVEKAPETYYPAPENGTNATMKTPPAPMYGPGSFGNQNQGHDFRDMNKVQPQ